MKTTGSEGSYRQRVAVLASSNILLQLLGFVYRMMLVNLAGTEALGLLSLAMQIYHIVVSVCISGLNVAVVALSAKLHAANDMAGISTLLRCAMRIYIVLFAAMSAPLALMRNQICTKLLGEDAHMATLNLLLICIFMTGIENILKSIHIGTKRVKNTAYSELLEQSARFIFVGILLKSQYGNSSSMNVTLIICGMLISEAFSVSFLTISYFKYHHIKFMHAKDNVRTMQPIFKQLIDILVPSAITSIACTVFASCASLLLPGGLMRAGYTRSQALSTIGSVTSIAGPVITLPFAFIGAVSTVLMPAIAEKAERASRKSLNELIERSFDTTSLVALPVTAALLPFSPVLSVLLFGSAPQPQVFGLLAVKTIIVYYQVISIGVLNGIMEQRKVLLYAILGEASQLALMLVLTGNKNLHIYGYLIAMIIGEGIRLIFNLAQIRRTTLANPIRATVAARSALIVAIMYMYSRYFAEFAEQHGAVYILIAAMTLPVIYILLNRLMNNTGMFKLRKMDKRPQ